MALAALLGLATGAPQRFEPARRALFDLYMRTLPRARHHAPVVIVEIDEPSLKRHGQWPWPRQLVAELVSRIAAARPAAIGLDMVMPEPDRLSPPNWARAMPTVPAELAGRVAALPDDDALLAQALAQAPSVIGVVGLDKGQGTRGPLAPVRSHGGDPLHSLPDFPGLARSLRVLDLAAHGHGLLSVDLEPDGIVRRLPTLARVGPALVPSLDVEMLRVAAHVPALDVALDGSGIRRVGIGPVVLDTEADGRLWLDPTPSDPRRFLSAADVLAGAIGPDQLDGRLVLVGVTGLGLQDHFLTPLGLMSGTEIHAQLLETIVDGGLPVRPRWAPRAELALTLGLGAALVGLLPRRGLPLYAAAAAAVGAVAAALGLAAWAEARWLIDVATPALGSAGVLVALLAGDLVDADRRRRRLRQALEQERLHAARLDGELAAARRIQLGLLPRPDSLAPDPRFDLEALMEPAEEVGGDLYDFFKIDDDHLFVAIGDVSGKGVPACVFMAMGKALYKSDVLSGVRDAGRVMTAASRDIARDNPEMLFITLFAGILELPTGRLSFANAGHEPPWLVLPGQAPRSLDGDSGPPLCTVDDYEYATGVIQLRPGEVVCLSTDGVSEAMNRTGALMGRAAAAASLAALPAGAAAADAVQTLRDAVRHFVDGAAPSDDLTVVALRWVSGR